MSILITSSFFILKSIARAAKDAKEKKTQPSPSSSAQPSPSPSPSPSPQPSPQPLPQPSPSPPQQSTQQQHQLEHELSWRLCLLRDMPTWRRLDSSPQLRHFLGLERSSRAQSPAAQHPLSHSFKQAYLTSCPQKMRIANGRVRGLSRRVLKKTAELDHNVYTLFSSMIKPHAYFLEVDRETSPLIGEIHLTDGILVLVVQLNDWQAHLDFLYQFLRKRKHVLRAPFDGVIYLVFNKNESSSLPIDASQIASELGEFMRRVSNVPLLVFSRQESPTRRSCSQIVDMLRLDELECAWSVREFPMRRARPSLYTLSTGWSTKLTKSTVEINRKHG